MLSHAKNKYIQNNILDTTRKLMDTHLYWQVLGKVGITCFILILYSSCAVFQSPAQIEFDGNTAEKEKLTIANKKQGYSKQMDADELATYLSLTNTQKNSFLELTEEYRDASSSIIANKALAYNDKLAQLTLEKESYQNKLKDIFSPDQFTKYLEHSTKSEETKQSTVTF